MRSSILRGRCLLAVSTYLAPRSLLDAGRAELEEWLDTRDLIGASRYWHLSNLSAFYAWAIREEHLGVDPTARIIRPRLPRRLPRPIGEDDLGMALELADARMRCWLLLAALAGLRCKEIALLRREDILDAAEVPLLVVTEGKGGHQRQVPAHPDVLAALNAYGLPVSGQVFRKQTAPEGAPPLLASTVSSYVSKYLHGLGIDATAHKGRHRFATSVYRASKDIRLTQELLGHSSPVTTAIYAVWDEDEAAGVVGSIGVGHKRQDARR